MRDRCDDDVTEGADHHVAMEATRFFLSHSALIRHLCLRGNAGAAALVPHGGDATRLASGSLLDCECKLDLTVQCVKNYVQKNSKFLRVPAKFP